ncbi:MAG: hypothetical protein AB1898_06920 [Acidobacteriota bacterium]
MSAYSSILQHILRQVEGAVAVGFADYEGETVQIEGRLEDYRHRLLLAYQGILFHNLAEQHAGESMQSITAVYEDLTTVIKPLRRGYFLLLTLDSRKNLFQADGWLNWGAEQVNPDI